MGVKRMSRMERVGELVWKLRAEAAREFRRAQRKQDDRRMAYYEGRFEGLSRVMNAIHDLGALIKRPRPPSGKAF